MADSGMERLVAEQKTTSAKIRVLDAAGYERAVIARFLGVRYQHVRNVLVGPRPKSGAATTPAVSESGAWFGSVRVNERDMAALMPALRVAGFNDGDLVSVEAAPGRLTIQSTDAALEAATALAAPFLKGKASAADELIRDRRKEARRGE